MKTRLSTQLQNGRILDCEYRAPIARLDPANALCSPKPVVDALYSLNFLKPSKVQSKSLPLMLSDPPRNMMAQSQSGTGKTAAFVTTILSRVDFNQPDQPQALALAPSRELARQIEGVVRSIGRFVETLKIAAAIPGGVVRNEPVHASVIVGTPGTTMDLIRRKQLDVSKLKLLVIDEADNMLDQQGLGDQCLRVKRCDAIHIVHELIY